MKTSVSTHTTALLLLCMTTVHNGPGFSPIEMFKEAEKVMKEAVSIMPDDPRFYFSLGVLLGKTQRLEVRTKHCNFLV